jgi:hypothetical protein
VSGESNENIGKREKCGEENRQYQWKLMAKEMKKAGKWLMDMVDGRWRAGGGDNENNEN